MKSYLILVAAGSGSRMGLGFNKVLATLGGKTIIEHTLLSARNSRAFSGVVVAARQDEVGDILTIARKVFPSAKVVAGGATRQESVAHALDAVPRDADIIAVHDGARCYTASELFSDCIKSAKKYGSGVAAHISTDTVKEVRGDVFVRTLDRSNIALAETPQTFRADLLRRAYSEAEKDGFVGTDDASLVERLGVEVRMVRSLRRNDKITHKKDLAMGEFIFGGGVRTGQGMDVHAFAEGRELILGGVNIPSEKGLLGHSDADVLTHAIMDALLGAAGLGDIGEHFPDSDEQYKGVSSLRLLAHVGELLSKNGLGIGNIDATLIMQAPKVSPYKDAMAENIARTLGTEVSRINIKATTTEKLGFAGRKEGAAAFAVCTLFAVSERGGR